MKEKCKNIFSTFCGHLICEADIAELFKGNQQNIECPQCRKFITKTQVFKIHL